MSKIVTRAPIRSGMPLGGIGTGSVELRPDGEFYEWQIDNPQQFSMDCRDIPYADNGNRHAGSLSFYILAQSAGKRTLRRLGMGFGGEKGQKFEEYNYRMHSFIKPVQEIEYEAKFPVAALAYRDSALPLDIRLTAASPFKPYDARTAGTPGIYLTFEIQNTSPESMTVSLAGKLRNILPEGKRENRVLEENGFTALWMRAPCAQDGEIALSVSGRDVSSIPGEYRGFMDEYVSHGEFGVSEESFLFTLRRRGALLSSGNSGPCFAPSWLDEEAIDQLSDEKVSALLEDAREYGFAESIVDRIVCVDPKMTQTAEGRRRLLRCIHRNGRDLARKGPWGDGALCSRFMLKPGEKRQVAFMLTWRFPRLVSGGGSVVGHVYENWFGSAVDAARFLFEHREEILCAAESLSWNFYHSSFPECLSDAVSQQTANLIKSSWWTKDNQFGMWEGLGSCGFHTTDITYHGSFGIVTLFPELQKAQMEMGARFQREDGRVHHFFTPDFSKVDDGFERVDMNPQFILLICRDYFVTGDAAYLKRIWPNIVKAIDCTANLDADGDGLPDQETGRNTYDAWRFSGTSAYISILWLAALKAACVLAEAVGDLERLPKWRGLIKKGIENTEAELFNGEYYDLWSDQGQTDACCMTDQLDGEYFSRLIGLGGILDERHVKAALAAIYHLNFSSENGLINASYPPGAKPTIFTYRNCQGTANWSGIEYMMSAFYLLMGMYKEGLSITETVQERYARLGETFNHAECGNHYYRPMSSWALMQALSGMSVDASKRRVRLEKGHLSEGFHAPWFAAGGFGQVTRLKNGWQIDCLYGTLEADEVQVDGNIKPLRIRLRKGDTAILP